MQEEVAREAAEEQARREEEARVFALEEKARIAREERERLELEALLANMNGNVAATATAVTAATKRGAAMPPSRHKPLTATAETHVEAAFARLPARAAAFWLARSRVSASGPFHQKGVPGRRMSKLPTPGVAPAGPRRLWVSRGVVEDFLH